MSITQESGRESDEPAPQHRTSLFDAHLHIIDPRFPLISNHGCLPPFFTVEDYRNRTADLDIIGGTVVSGSFQGFDQTYLLDALARLGPSFVGVTQLPATVTTEQIMTLTAAGVRAVRFNLYRGGRNTLEYLADLALHVYDIAGWHTELYIDTGDLPDLEATLAALPRISIDHLGLTRGGLPALLRLVERGAYVKATGFSRGDLDIASALQDLARANPSALMAGTDLPSTRAPRPFEHADLDLIVKVLGTDLAAGVLRDNARELYGIKT